MPDAVDALAERILATGATPGLALAVTDRDGGLDVRCYGLADPAAGRPVTPDTLFEIGSITKSFTAVCLMRRVDGGELDLQAEVRSLVPLFPVPGVTVHQLLTHTAGTADGPGRGPVDADVGAPAGADDGAAARAVLVLEPRLPGARHAARAADRRALPGDLSARDLRAARHGVVRAGHPQRHAAAAGGRPLAGRRRAAVASGRPAGARHLAGVRGGRRQRLLHARPTWRPMRGCCSPAATACSASRVTG